jgi:hypothetical protein
MVFTLNTLRVLILQTFIVVEGKKRGRHCSAMSIFFPSKISKELINFGFLIIKDTQLTLEWLYFA